MKIYISIRLENKTWIKVDKYPRFGEEDTPAVTPEQERIMDKSFFAINDIRRLHDIRCKMSKVKGNELAYDECGTVMRLIGKEIEEQKKNIRCNPYDSPAFMLLDVQKRKGTKMRWVKVRKSVEYTQNGYIFDVLYENGRAVTYYGLENVPNNAKWFVENADICTTEYDRTFSELVWFYEMESEK